MILSILIIYYTKSKNFWNSQYCVMVSTKNNVYFYVENVINSITKMMWLDHILNDGSQKMLHKISGQLQEN